MHGYKWQHKIFNEKTAMEIKFPKMSHGISARWDVEFPWDVAFSQDGISTRCDFGFTYTHKKSYSLHGYAEISWVVLYNALMTTCNYQTVAAVEWLINALIYLYIIYTHILI